MIPSHPLSHALNTLALPWNRFPSATACLPQELGCMALGEQTDEEQGSEIKLN
jgi:hypothetical protein